MKRFLLGLFSAILLAGCGSTEKEVTYAIVSDLHFWGVDSIDARNDKTIELLNSMEGIAFPDSIGGKIENLRGVVITGDITNDGNELQWRLFEEFYGLNGSAKLKLPVYEGIGNHDGEVDGPVRKSIIERNKTRKDVTNVSENGLHYSWDWDGVHFVQLNLYPSAAWDSTCGWCHYFTKSTFREPQESLQFLEADLAKVGKDTPVVLLFHYGWDTFSAGSWWTDAERENFFKAIESYNIAGVFTGHCHGFNYLPSNGIDTWSCGSGAKDGDNSDIIIVRIKKDKEMVVAQYSKGAWQKIYKKDLSKK